MKNRCQKNKQGDIMFVYSREQEGGGAERLIAAPVTSAPDGDLNYRQTEAIASQHVPSQSPALPHTVPKYFPLLVW